MTPTITTSSTTELPPTESLLMPAASPKPIASTLPAAPVSSDEMIVFEDVSKFYGEILGVNRVNLQIAPGITSLVGPNGSGKTTLMNLMTGLLKPTQGRIRVLGTSPNEPEAIFQKLGTVRSSIHPRGATAREFIEFYLPRSRLHETGHRLRWRTLRLNAYQWWKRQTVKFSAFSTECGSASGSRSRSRTPVGARFGRTLNGLTRWRAPEIIRLFRSLADAGMYLSSQPHSARSGYDERRVVLLHNGYVVAEGEVHGVRDEIEEHPIQILIRCDRPQVLAARLFEHEHTVEARIHNDRQGLFVKTRRPDDFYLLLNRVITEQNLQVESVAPVDDDLNAVYQY